VAAKDTYFSFSLERLAARRQAAVDSLLHSLKHLSREQQYATLTSWMSVGQLEECAAFQRTKDADTPQGARP
jgi:hypothetical protein